jgi:hypothetical protein
VSEEQKPIPDRLVVVSHVYHRPIGDKNRRVKEVTTRFSRKLRTKEQVYSRILTATSNLLPLDLGWFGEKPVSHLVIENLGDNSIRLTYAGSPHGWDIPPGESFSGTPTSLSILRIQCPDGESEYSLHILPG